MVDSFTRASRFKGRRREFTEFFQKNLNPDPEQWMKHRLKSWSWQIEGLVNELKIPDWGVRWRWIGKRIR
jgi:hypothetical protein